MEQERKKKPYRNFNQQHFPDTKKKDKVIFHHSQILIKISTLEKKFST